MEDGVLETFRKVGGDPGLSDEELLEREYLDEQLIDSLEFVHLVTGLEERFDITFEPDELESVRFRTLEGVAEIVVEKRTDGSSKA